MNISIENNKLIAEFMGLTVIDKKDITEKTDVTKYSVTEYQQYHKSWDWLIPVVEKIEQTITIDKDFNEHHDLQVSWRVIIYDGTCEIYYSSMCYGQTLKFSRESTTKLEATYKAVVEFIKWYNENKKVSEIT
jgi:hypothetical protein